MNSAKITGLLALCALVISCGKEDMSTVPSLTYLEMGWNNPTSKDTMYIDFRVKDKDADVGGPYPALFYKCFDEYDTLRVEGWEYLAPADPSIVDTTKGIDAKTRLKVPAYSFAIGEKIWFKIAVADRAGHTSDTLKTPDFIVQ